MKAFLCLAALALASTTLQAQWMTGYYAAGNSSQPISSIPWSKYTHIVHFATAPTLSANGSATGRLGMYYLTQNEINQIIAARPAGKKVLVSVKVNDANFNSIVQSLAPSLFSTFVSDIVNLVVNNGYDGVDLDWEHGVDINAYHNLIVGLRNAMPGKLISITTGDWEGLETVAGQNYTLVDQINVMCYDMDWAGGGYCNGTDCTWYNSPIHQAGDVWKSACDLRVGRITAKGVPNSKLGIGVPFYGRRQVGTTMPQTHGVFPMYRYDYRNMVSDASRWQAAYMNYDSAHGAEYLSIPSYNEFISFNGVRTMAEYANWVRAKGYGGMMAYTLDEEYLPSQSGDARYPLSTAIYNALYPASAPAAPPAAPPPPVSGSIPSTFVSPSSGTGTGQTFTIQMTGSSGASAINQMDFVVEAPVPVNSCWVEYWAPTKTAYLKSDNGLAWTSAVLGSSKVISNSQCTLNAQASGATAGAVSLSISFSHAFAGAKSIYTFIGDNAGKASPWVYSGAYTAQ